MDIIYLLFDKLHPIQVQNRYIDSMDTLRRRPTLLTGHRALDSSIRNSWTNVMMSIVSDNPDQRTILAVVEDGGGFRASDAVLIEIYRIIGTHLASWDTNSRGNPIDRTPRDDLERLSMLARKIYENALMYKKQDAAKAMRESIANSSVAQRFLGGTLIETAEDTHTPVVPVLHKEEEHYVKPEARYYAEQPRPSGSYRMR